ncbi:hypothetical protein SOVF_059670 [Spinacia oleracea]|nr:hypothetical protein SOVF_059670 [Spinacia oleracea]
MDIQPESAQRITLGFMLVFKKFPDFDEQKVSLDLDADGLLGSVEGKYGILRLVP